MSRVVVCGSLNMDVVVAERAAAARRRDAAGADGVVPARRQGPQPGRRGGAARHVTTRDGWAPSATMPSAPRCWQSCVRGFLADNDVDSSACAARAHDRRRADPGGRRRQRHHRRLRRQHAVHAAPGPRPPARDEVSVAQFETPIATHLSWPCAPRPGARTVLNDARPCHGPSPCPPAEMRRRRRPERDRARPGDRRQPARHQRATPVVAACEKLRARGARAVIATLGDRAAPSSSRPTARPAFPAFGPRSSTRPAPAIASSARWPPAWPPAPRWSRRRATPSPPPPAPSRSSARRPRCRRPGKLRRGWRGPKSLPWSKNSSGRTPISRKPTPP